MMCISRAAARMAGRARMAGAWLLLFGFLLGLAAPAPAKTTGDLPWLDFQTALAGETDKPVLIFFQAPWCSYCRRMQQQVFSRPDIREMMARDFVLVDVDVVQDEKLAAKLGVSLLPTIWFLDREKAMITNIKGFIPPDKFALLLEYVSGGHYKRQGFAEFAQNR